MASLCEEYDKRLLTEQNEHMKDTHSVATPPTKGPYWKKYISKFSMIGGSINPAGQNGSREKRGRLCELLDLK